MPQDEDEQVDVSQHKYPMLCTGIELRQSVSICATRMKVAASASSRAWSPQIAHLHNGQISQEGARLGPSHTCTISCTLKREAATRDPCKASRMKHRPLCSAVLFEQVTVLQGAEPV